MKHVIPKWLALLSVWCLVVALCLIASEVYRSTLGMVSISVAAVVDASMVTYWIAKAKRE